LRYRDVPIDTQIKISFPYQNIVVAQDFGSGSILCSSVLCQVNIRRRGNSTENQQIKARKASAINKFQFKQLYSAQISENMQLGSTVIQVNTTYPDCLYQFYSDWNGTLKLSNVSDDGFFAISVSTGAIYLNKAIDRETNDNFVLKIQALSSSIYIQTGIPMSVNDVNDNATVFEEPNSVLRLEIPSKMVPIGLQKFGSVFVNRSGYPMDLH